MTAPSFDLGPCTGLSPFQCEFLRKITQDPTFVHFILVDGDIAQTFSHVTPAPLNVLWYDNTGELHSDRVGVKKVLRRIVTTRDPTARMGVGHREIEV